MLRSWIRLASQDWISCGHRGRGGHMLVAAGGLGIVGIIVVVLIVLVIIYFVRRA